MNIKKPIIALLSSILIISSATGCQSYAERKGKEAEKLKEMALDYLHTYYDDDFLPVRLRSKSFVDPYDLIVFKSEKYNAREFAVYHYDDNKFSDNYFTLQLEKEGQLYFAEILKELSIEGSIKIGFFGDGRPEKLPRNPQFEDYLNYGTMSFTIYVFTETQLAADKRKMFIDTLVENRFNPSISFITVEISLAEIENYELDEILRQAETLFVVKNSYSISVDFEVEEHPETVYIGSSE